MCDWLILRGNFLCFIFIPGTGRLVPWGQQVTTCPCTVCDKDGTIQSNGVFLPKWWGLAVTVIVLTCSHSQDMRVLLFWKDVIWLQQSSLIFTVNNTPCTPSVRMIVMAETFLITKFTGITVCSGSHAYGKLRIFWSSEQSISVISMFRHFYNLELSECKGGGQIIKHLYNLMPCIKYCFCGSEAGHL